MLVNKDTKIFYGNTEIKKIYLGNNLIWQRQTYDDSTLAVINYANANGYTLPSNLTALDNLIKGLKACGIWALLDRFWLFSGDGSTDFKRINIINPSKKKADFYGGLTISASGVEGNGTNAYINTNFNPALLESGQKYQLNNAGRGACIFLEATNTVLNRSIDGIYSGFINNMGNYNLPAQRINQGNDNSSVSINFTGIGLKLISRISDTNVQFLSKDIVTSSNSTSIDITNANQFILRNNTAYGNSGISCYFMGASIPSQVSQDFRTVFNTYLQAIGQNPIA
ncbi:MAG: hypothetical protein ACRC0E_07335 [Soonwooa sp.]